MRVQIRDIAVTAFAGAFAGLLAFGVGGRIAMRASGALAEGFLQGVMTSETGTVGLVTWSGTAEVFVLGAMLGAIGAPFVWLARPFLPRSGRALALGALILLVMGASVVDANNSDFRRFGIAPLNAVLFAALPFLYAAILLPVATRLAVWFPDHGIAFVLYAPVVVLALALAFLGSFLVAEDHPVVSVAMWALVAAGLIARVPALGPWRRGSVAVPAAIGFVGLAVGLAGVLGIRG